MKMKDLTINIEQNQNRKKLFNRKMKILINYNQQLKENQKKKDKKTEKNYKQQSNSKSESDTEILSSRLKYSKLDKYLPGNKFQSTFIDKNLDSTKKKI